MAHTRGLTVNWQVRGHRNARGYVAAKRGRAGAHAFRSNAVVGPAPAGTDTCARDQASRCTLQEANLSHRRSARWSLRRCSSNAGAHDSRVSIRQPAAVVPASLVDADQVGALQDAHVIGDGRFVEAQFLIEQRAWDVFRAAGEHYPEHLDPYRLA